MIATIVINPTLSDDAADLELELRLEFKRTAKGQPDTRAEPGYRAEYDWYKAELPLVRMVKMEAKDHTPKPETETTWINVTANPGIQDYINASMQEPWLLEQLDEVWADLERGEYD
jgi:hypothetical protein